MAQCLRAQNLNIHLDGKAEKRSNSIQILKNLREKISNKLWSNCEIDTQGRTDSENMTLIGALEFSNSKQDALDFLTRLNHLAVLAILDDNGARIIRSDE